MEPELYNMIEVSPETDTSLRSSEPDHKKINQGPKAHTNMLGTETPQGLP